MLFLFLVLANTVGSADADISESFSNLLVTESEKSGVGNPGPSGKGFKRKSFFKM